MDVYVYVSSVVPNLFKGIFQCEMRVFNFLREFFAK